MKLYVGVTDNGWYHYLAGHQPDEANFWHPGGAAFRALQPGELFLFKLHSPERSIAGGGYFLSHTSLPLSLAWEAFGDKNGTPDFETFERKIRGHRSGKGAFEPDPTIGCTVLLAPFFWPREAWIPEPAEWKNAIVSGKGYDLGTPAGAHLWQQVKERLQPQPGAPVARDERVLREEAPVYGRAYLQKARLGQGAFRVLVTDAYARRCVVTGERTLPVLQAAHIKPVSRSGPNRLDNGLLLRADLHILLDKGLLTVTPDLHVEVSRRIKELFENGRDYYALHGRPLIVPPAAAAQRPARDYLEWHNQNVFVP